MTKDLLQRFRGGDPDAFGAIYRAHHPAIYRFALHMTADPSKAGELAQDVFVWLIHHAEDFDPERGELGAFLTGVARKFLLRRRSEEMRWLPLDDAAVDRRAARVEREPDMTDTERLRAAIAALPISYREVVVLCDLEGRSYEEAAGMLDCAVGTIRSRLHRARALLTRKLQAKEAKEENAEVVRCAI